MKKNMLLAIVSTLVTVVVCEYAVRFILPQISNHDTMFQFEETLGWEFIPNKKGRIVYDGGIDLDVQINGEGYRDRPFMNKIGDTKIMVLGDSFVSNIAVGEEEVFTQQMEKIMPNTSVYNLGVNGYGQVQEYLVLKKWLSKIEPDIIVLLVYLRNDFTDNVGTNSWLYPRPTVSFDTDTLLQINRPPPFVNEKKKLPVYYKSHLYRLVKKSLSNLEAKTSKETDRLSTPPEVYICSTLRSDKTIAMYDTMQQLLLEIKEYGKSANTPVVFALAPSMFQVEDALWSEIEAYDTTLSLQRDLPNKTLLAFAKERDLDMIDLMPFLQKEHREGSKVYNATEQHWTSHGNRVVAEVLSTYLNELVIKKRDSL